MELNCRRSMGLIVRLRDFSRKDAHLPGKLIVFGDEHELQQLILNLVGNARDGAVASAPGRVQLRLRRVHGYSRIEVENTGAAIPLGVQSKIFAPYFTTKGKGQGTGLGLSICERIARKHSGRILFCSEEGKTIFVADFPTL